MRFNMLNLLRLLNRRAFGISVLALGACFAGPSEAAVSQEHVAAPNDSMSFEVASVHETQPGQSFTVAVDNPYHRGNLSVTNLTLSDLISIAFGLTTDRFNGLPDWAHERRYNIQAKAGSDVDEALASMSDDAAKRKKQEMLQALLRDRFGVRSHTEMQVAPGLALTAEDGGQALRKQGTLPVTSDEHQRFADTIPRIYQSEADMSGYVYRAHGCSMAELAELLHALTKQPVTDSTGLAGRYDFVLSFSDDRDVNAEDSSDKPPLFEALRKELGLRLMGRKVSAPLLVIDHASPPSEN